ncbi:MAG: hypothetical protein GYA71_05815 [Bacteroidales bacterium]|nr:hypothetical protein [Bacteroidales bacterium]
MNGNVTKEDIRDLRTFISLQKTRVHGKLKEMPLFVICSYAKKSDRI